jgi:hypothetical protein
LIERHGCAPSTCGLRVTDVAGPPYEPQIGHIVICG